MAITTPPDKEVMAGLVDEESVSGGLVEPALGPAGVDAFCRKALQQSCCVLDLCNQLPDALRPHLSSHSGSLYVQHRRGGTDGQVSFLLIPRAPSKRIDLGSRLLLLGSCNGPARLSAMAPNRNVPSSQRGQVRTQEPHCHRKFMLTALL